MVPRRVVRWGSSGGFQAGLMAKRREARAAAARAARKQRVEVLRAYRCGDYPDIQSLRVRAGAIRSSR